MVLYPRSQLSHTTSIASFSRTTDLKYIYTHSIIMITTFRRFAKSHSKGNAQITSLTVEEEHQISETCPD